MIRHFNEDWIFHKEHGKEKKVDLPYDAMIHEKRQADCLNGINSGFFPGGKYTYRKTFSLSEEELQGKIFLHFEGVYGHTIVYLNGNEVKRHDYGYTCFDADLSDAAKAGENEVKVVADNSLEPNCRWYSGSGIYRDVDLYILPEDYIEECFIETLSYDPLRVKVSAKTAKDTKIDVEIYDGNRLISSFPAGEKELEGIRLWSEEDPKLYTIKIKSAEDERKFRYGFRKLEWAPEKGMRINGKEVLLRGGCIHHDHGILGANEYYDAEYRRISLLKKNGFNAVRMAHNPASQIILDICDELGMYVMDEAFDGWYIPKTYHDYSRDFEKCRKEDLRALVASGKNHPSVIIYSIGNEVSETASEKGVRVCKEMRDYVHSLDKTRPVTSGINVLLNVFANMGMGVYRDKGEYQAVAQVKKKGYQEKKTGSAFFNAFAQKLGKMMFYMSKGNKGDKASKGAGEVLDILGLNYASSRYDEDVKKYPKRMMVGSETMVADLPYNWERVKKYPQLIGDFVWSAWDYLGEACIGDWTYASYKGLPLLAGQGMIDICGKPLAAMAYMQVVWGLRKKPYIGIRPLNHHDEVPNKGSWQFTNAIDSYSWEGYEGVKTVAEVYGRGQSVELFLNGRSLGSRRYRDYKAVFTFPYETGTLTARSYDEQGRPIEEMTLKSAKKDTVLTISSDRKVLKKGELAYLEISFTDKEGKLKPYLEEDVRIEIEGPAELLGFGSALCKSDETYDSHTHKTYRGNCLAVIRGKKENGRVIIHAHSGRTDTAAIEIEVRGNE